MAKTVEGTLTDVDLEGLQRQCEGFLLIRPPDPLTGPLLFAEGQRGDGGAFARDQLAITNGFHFALLEALVSPCARYNDFPLGLGVCLDGGCRPKGVPLDTSLFRGERRTKDGQLQG